MWEWKDFKWQADWGCATEAVLCHGRNSTIIFCIIWYISLYLDRLFVILMDGELLWGNSGITVAGFGVIPPQALKNLPTTCCSHIGYVLRRSIGRYVSTRDQRGNWFCVQWKSTNMDINWYGHSLMAYINDSINDFYSWRALMDAINGIHLKWQL